MTDEFRSPLPLTEAIEALSLARSDPLSDDSIRNRQVIISRTLDLLRELGLAVDPGSLVPQLAPSSSETLGLLSLLEQTAANSDGVRQTLLDLVEHHRTQFDNATPTTLANLFLQQVLIGPLLPMAAYLPSDVIELNDFRREEFLRTWAASAGIPIRSNRGVETETESQGQRFRLDYRRTLADERRFQIERNMIEAQHKKVRRLQERRERAAMASASRE